MPTYEGLRLKILEYKRLKFANKRRAELKNTNFTIISNNCWGGMIYESYNLPKQSPTIGLYFMAEDYIKFISRLKDYISTSLTFIKPEDSRWKNTEQISNDKRFGSYPIGVLSLEDESIEIFFLHYHSEQEARDKWERRCQRINWNNMIIKFNDQNGCSIKEVDKFMKLPLKNKIFFTCKHWEHLASNNYIYIKQFSKSNHILASYEPFGKNKYFDITNFINEL